MFLHGIGTVCLLLSTILVIYDCVQTRGLYFSSIGYVKEYCDYISEVTSTSCAQLEASAVSKTQRTYPVDTFQKQSPGCVLQKFRSKKNLKVHRKTTVSEFLLDEVLGLQPKQSLVQEFLYELCKIFQDTFF